MRGVFLLAHPFRRSLDILNWDFSPLFMCVTSLQWTQCFRLFRIVSCQTGVWIKDFNILGNLDCSVNYGFIAVIEFGMRTIEFSDNLQFPLTRRMDWANLMFCLMPMMSDGDAATHSTAEYVNYCQWIIISERNEFPLFFRGELDLRKFSFFVQ